MAVEWTETVLQEIAANIDRAFAMGPFGSNIKAENYRESGVPVIRGTNLGDVGDAPFRAYEFVFLDEEKADDLASSNCSPDDIVFVAQGTVGKVGIVPADTPYGRFVLSQNLMKVTVHLEKADPRFVFYFFRSSLGQHEIMSRVNPTGVPCISKPLTSLRQFGIRLPADVREQRTIAHILGTLDDKIELNRRMNETLEAMARALFKSWFVDFEPVRAKAEGRARQDGARSGQLRKPLNVASALPWPGAQAGAGAEGDPGTWQWRKEILDLFPARLVDSELGELPKGWEVVPLPKAIEINPARSLRKGEAAPYLDMANMPTQGHSPDVVVDRPFGSGMRFVNGDTLVARITPCLENGKTAYVDFLEAGQVGWGSTEYIVLRPKPPIPEEFAYCLARSDGFREFAIQSMTGSSGRQRVPAESLSHYLLAAPPEQLAKRFGSFVQPLFARASAAARESRTLAALRDTLLPKLISGELRVLLAKVTA
ncbi:MAG: restriction endonuclease subunit S [Gammaproteobacteria bacterium]